MHGQEDNVWQKHTFTFFFKYIRHYKKKKQGAKKLNKHTKCRKIVQHYAEQKKNDIQELTKDVEQRNQRQEQAALGAC